MSKEIEQDGFITRSEDLRRSKPKDQKGMVLIKTLDMPDNCADCRLKDYYYGECKVTYKKIKAYIDNNSRPRSCPLSEVVPYGPEGTLYKEK